MLAAPKSLSRRRLRAPWTAGVSEMQEHFPTGRLSRAEFAPTKACVRLKTKWRKSVHEEIMLPHCSFYIHKTISNLSCKNVFLYIQLLGGKLDILC